MSVFSEYLYTFFKEKNSQEMVKKWGNPDSIPSCFTGQSWEMMGVCFSLPSGALREMWQLRAREKW